MPSSVKKNFLWNASYQLLMVLAPLVTTPYLSRVLGAEQVGVYSYTYAVTNYFVMFATLGMGSYGVRTIAAAGSERAARSRVFWSVWFSQLLVAVPVCAAYAVYLAFVGSQGGLAVGLVWGMWVLSAALDVNWLFFGVEEFKLPTARSFVTKLASVAVIFLFVDGPQDLWVYCAAIAGSFLANQLIVWPFVRRYVDFSLPNWSDVRVHLLPNLRLFAPVVAISLYTSFDKIMLGAIAGMEQAGFFEYSEKLSKMPMAVITAMGAVMLPRMTAALSEGLREKAVSLLGRSMWAMQIAAMGLAFGIGAIAPEFAPVFLGEGYESCEYVMPVVAVVIPLISASNVIGVQYMLPSFSDKHYTASVCAGAVVNIALNLVLIAPFGALGAAWATVAAEVAVLGWQCWVVRHDLPLLRYLREALPFALCGALMYVCVRLLSPVLGGATVSGLVLELVFGIVIYLALALAWCLAARRGELRELLGGSRRKKT